MSQLLDLMARQPKKQQQMTLCRTHSSLRASPRGLLRFASKCSSLLRDWTCGVCVVCDGESPPQSQSPGLCSILKRFQPSCFPPGSVSPPQLPEKRTCLGSRLQPSVLRTGPSTPLGLLLSLGQSRRSGQSPPGWHRGTEAGSRGLRPVLPCPGSW